MTKQDEGFIAVIAMVTFCIGEAMGNIAPDYSDVAYYTAVLNGSINDHVTSFIVYDILPCIQYLLIGLIIGLAWYSTRNTKLTLRVAVWVFSFVYISATVLLFGLFSTLLPDYSIALDVLTCVTCILAILAVEGELTMNNVKKLKFW